MRHTTVLLAASLLLAALTACGTSTDDKPAAATSSTPTDDTITPAADPEPTPEDTGPEVMSLTDSIEYTDGVEVTLSDYKRGTTSAYASPESTPYVSFTVKIVNGSGSTVDIGTGYVMCYYGDESRESEQVFDSDRGLEGMPSMRLRAGRTAKATVGCELPKGEEYLQVEMAPHMEADVAVFAGNVK